MAKLAILAGLLVALLAIADASTVTTTVIEENAASRRHQGGQMEQCRQEIEGRQFRQCQMYLTMGQMQGGRRGGRSHNDAIENPQQEQYMWECCEEMNDVMPMCRCDAIQEAVEMAMYEPQYQGQGMEEVMRMAMNLPKMCKWTEPTMCDMRPVVV
ncbi:hypothetical protein LIER_13665 [Lithospermum erythrorhizon]|uniref:Bifunctional inhibitor/plant lipid transfer protein/seed storage helical domain-containing protein n=1 Tax=Lithospermum erythrorhizon TaxID=34254 RepID=A0AAV3Q0V4_LITER